MNDFAQPLWRRYLRFIRPNAAADLDDEIAFHVTARIEELIAGGMSRDDAEAAALRRFGDVAYVRSQTLRIDHLWEREKNMRERSDAIIADVTFALRQLRRSPVLATAAILCFALGIGVNSAIFSIVNGVLIRPLPYRDVDRIVFIKEGLPKMGPGMGTRISPAEFVDYRALDGRVFQSSAIYESRNFTVRAPDGTVEQVQGAVVSGNFLRVLGREPALGHIPPTWAQNAANPTATLGTQELIVSHSFWRTRLGGDSSIIGNTMPLDGSVVTIAGVMPPDVQFPIGGLGVTPAEVFAPYELSAQVMEKRADNYATWAFARLADGVSIDRASAAVANIASNLPRRYPDFYRGGTAAVVGGVSPLREAITGSVRQPLLVLLAAVCLVLLIACLNVSSLLMARSVSRQREIAVRRALGASRSRLAQQFLTESLVLVVIGALLGLLVGRYGAAALAQLDPNGSFIGYDIGLDWRVLTVTAAVTVLTGIVFSVLPGLAGRDDLQTSIRESDTPRNSLSRSGLVVAEIAIALLLTMGAGLMVRSFLHLRDVDPGFRADRLLTFRVNFPESRYPTQAAAHAAQLLLAQRLQAIPGVDAVSSATDIPAAEPSWIVYTPDPAVGPLPDKAPVGSISLVQPGYFETMAIRVRAGRTFNSFDAADRELVAIVGETLAKQRYGGASALGRRIKWGGPDSPSPWRRVVGVVADIKQTGLAQEDPAPAIYMPAAQVDTGPVASIVRGQNYVLRTADNRLAISGSARRAVRDFDALMPITGLTPMDELLSSTIADRRFNMFLLGAFAAVALGLAAVGIYGLTAYSVAQRTRELGIRIALGAAPRDVLLLVIRQGATLALAGILIGSLGAIAATRWMRSMLFQVDPLDPLTFVAVAGALAAVAIGATWAPALRAARVSPVTAMRTD
jgi:putative ABC transport system permease protein